MKILSLFDGIACGMIAMKELGINIERYVAYEYDETSAKKEKGRPFGYPAMIASHNFPEIEQNGDVFNGDFTKYEGFDWVLAGFPCTKFSIAQKNDRETKPYSGIGWDLFEQAWRAVQEAKPKYFLFENNKSMAKEIQNEISRIVGFDPVNINSALLSAQSRQRIYWVGKRNKDGTYSKVNVAQPEDKKLLLTDILEGGFVDREKSFPLLTTHQGNARDYFKKQHAQIVYEPLADFEEECDTKPVGDTVDGKSKTIRGQYHKTSIANFLTNGKHNSTGVAEPVRVPQYTYEDKSRPVTACYAYKGDGEGSLSSECFNTNPKKQVRDYVAEPIKVGCFPSPDGTIKNGQGMRIYDIDGKSVSLKSLAGGMGAKTGLYAIPVAFKDGEPTRAISFTDKKEHQVYKVENHKITVNGLQYPIDLKDGYYLIRKLTVKECMRLQTIPEWYEFPVSDTQSYKALGNGWTISVISYLINAALENEIENSKSEKMNENNKKLGDA